MMSLPIAEPKLMNPEVLNKNIPMNRKWSIPYYIKLQAIGSNFEDHETESANVQMPDTLRWRKLNHLISTGYLGRFPGFFLDGSPQNEEYLSRVLNLIDSYKPKESDTITDTDYVLELDNDTSDRSYGGYYLNGNATYRQIKESGVSDPAIDLRLPKGWSLDSTNQVDVSEDLQSLKTGLIENNYFNIYPRSSNKGGVVTVPLDCLPSFLIGIYYFEITITEGTGYEIDMAIGFIKEELKSISDVKIKNIDLRVPDDRVVSWYGKNGLFTVWNGKRDDRAFCGFGKGDTIGLGFNQVKDEFFITKNGNYLGSHGSIDSFINKGFEGKNNTKGLLPCVCFGSWTGAKLNLGDDPNNLFSFDIEYYVKKNKNEVMDKIETTRFMNNSKSELNFIDSVIMGYLKHNGYAQTAKGFEKDIMDLRNEDVSEVRKKGFELCELKEQIKHFMNQDQYDKVVELLVTQYPTFFDDNSKILFRLEVVRLLYNLDHGIFTVKQGIERASELKELFSDEESQYYVDQISVVFSYSKVRDCPLFSDFFDLDKTKIVYAIQIALNKINNLSLVSPLDKLILQADEKLVSNMQNLGKDKSVLLINLLDDYVKKY